MQNERMLTRIYTADVFPLEEEGFFRRKYREVSERRRRKIDALHFSKDQCLSLGAELLLMQACRDFHVDYEEETVVGEDFFKPAFSACPLQFNLSHSGKRVMCIMSPFSVGCDVEWVDTSFSCMEIAERFFCREESLALKALGQEERAKDFYRLWTLKESFVKCTGMGMQLPLHDFCVSLRDGRIHLKQSYDDAAYRLFELQLQDGYCHAFCIKAEAENDFSWLHIPADLTE